MSVFEVTLWRNIAQGGYCASCFGVEVGNLFLTDRQSAIDQAIEVTQRNYGYHFERLPSMSTAGSGKFYMSFVAQTGYCLTYAKTVADAKAEIAANYPRRKIYWTKPIRAKKLPATHSA